MQTKINSKLNISFYVSHNYIIFFLRFIFWQFWKFKKKQNRKTPTIFCRAKYYQKTKLLRHLSDWKNNFLDFFFDVRFFSEKNTFACFDWYVVMRFFIRSEIDSLTNIFRSFFVSIFLFCICRKKLLLMNVPNELKFD